jgi:TonB family protein
MKSKILGTLVFLLASAATTAITSGSSSAQDPPASVPPATDTVPLRNRGRMDVRHPLHVGSDYYPKQSLKNGEQGKCTLAFFIESDGTVPAAQLLVSSGHPRLDTACFESVIGIPMIPAIINGTPVAGWYDFNVAWVINHARPYQQPSETPAFPRIADDHEFQVGQKFYPEAARANNQRGYCVVHTTVGSNGTALNPSITRSTGSATLDKACLAAVNDARFTPELQDGQPVADATDIAIYW